jgi:PTH1 family peptidyl-tRNA hydrolase
MKIIIGLGNPGEEYKKTRHNIGFMVIDTLREKLDFPEFKKDRKFNALISKGEYNDEKILLVKPQTFINLSGICVASLMNFFKVDPKDLFIIYDDVDLLLGKIRIRKKGGSGTHNGMKSIIDHIGETSFPRFRVGIESRGETAPRQMDISSFVLSSFNNDEEKAKDKAVIKACNGIIFALDKGIAEAMNKYNS